jgi:hypothetical protein
MTTMNLPVVEAERPRPFHCGSQAVDWEQSNCARCTKAYDERTSTWPCDLERAIDEAGFGDGTVSPDVARRMGYDGSPTAYVWPCTEVVWTEAWKAESRRRRTVRYRVARRWWSVRTAVRGRWQKWRERRRMVIADREFARHPETCWAEWVIWAMYPDPERQRPGPHSADECREQGKCGSCYCGRFQNHDAPR